jgi:hypothetical protein
MFFLVVFAFAPQPARPFRPEQTYSRFPFAATPFHFSQSDI